MARPALSRDTVAIVVGVLAPVVVCLALVPFRDSFANTNAALLLVVVVVAVAANGHRLAGILAAVSAGLSFDFFLTQPYERLTITDRADVETAVLLLVVGAVVSELAARGRHHRAIAVTDEAYLDGIQRTTEMLAAGAEPLDVARHVSRQLVPLLGLRSCRFEQGTFLGQPHRLRSDGQVPVDGAPWPVDTEGFPPGDLELLVHSGRRVEGRFLMTPEAGILVSVGARRVAFILAEQAGAAFAGRLGTRPR